MSKTAGKLAAFLEAALEGDAQSVIHGIAAPGSATATDLIYVESAKFASRAQSSAARCVLTQKGIALEGKTRILVAEPRLAFAKAAEWLRPAERIVHDIHPTAIIARSATLASGVAVGPYAVIEDDVSVGEQCEISAFCFIGKGARLGVSCRLYPRVTLYAGVRLGDRVIVHSGAVLGGDGFGYVWGEGKYWKLPQGGQLEIGDNVEIGCNTTVDRGALEKTIIGEGTKLDNLVQIAHNVRIGKHTVIAAQTGIAGSAVVGDHVVVAGQAGLGDHCIVEDRAILGGQVGILPGKIVRSGETVWGTPSRPLQKFKEQFALTAKLPRFALRLRKLENCIYSRRGAGEATVPED